MTTITGAFVDATSEAAIEAQLLSLATTGDKIIVIPVGSKVYLGKSV